MYSCAHTGTDTHQKQCLGGFQKIMLSKYLSLGSKSSRPQDKNSKAKGHIERQSQEILRGGGRGREGGRGRVEEGEREAASAEPLSIWTETESFCGGITDRVSNKKSHTALGTLNERFPPPTLSPQWMALFREG